MDTSAQAEKYRAADHSLALRGVPGLFRFHAYHGEFGIYSKYRLEAETVDLQGKLDAVKARRLDLQRRVQLMHQGTLEKDMLDEQARKALNMSHADEITIMLPATAR